MASLTAEDIFSYQVASHSSVSEWRSSSKICEQRAVLLIQPEDLRNNLTASTLALANALPIRPFVFVDNERGVLNSFHYLGEGLAGHSGMMHGGLLAVLLDECLGRACFPLLPNRVAVTASLQISYQAPMNVPGIIFIQAETEKVEGSKAWVRASVKKLGEHEVLLATATALFVEPKRAEIVKKLMQESLL